MMTVMIGLHRENIMRKVICEKRILLSLTITFFIASIIMFALGWYKGNVYREHDTSVSNAVNAYTNIKADDYRINIIYSRGYCVLGGTFLFASTINLSTFAILNIYLANRKTVDYEGERNYCVRTIKNRLQILAGIFVVIAVVFFSLGFYKKNVYVGRTADGQKKINAYTLNDSDNYKINGTYFVGYSVLGGSCFIVATILFSTSELMFVVDLRKKETDT